MRAEHTGCACDQCAEHERQVAVLHHVDTHRRGHVVVLTDRVKCAAGARAVDAHEEVDQQSHKENQMPCLRFARDVVQPQGAAGDGAARQIVDVQHEDPHHFTEADGSNGQIDAAEPQDGQSQQQTDDTGRQRAGQHADQQRRVQVDRQQRANIGTD